MDLFVKCHLKLHIDTDISSLPGTGPTAANLQQPVW